MQIPRTSRERRAEFQEQLRQTRGEIRAQVRATRVQFDQANARLTARTGRNLLFAIGVGIVLGAAVLLSLLLVKSIFVVFAIVLVGFAAGELAGALRQSGRDVPIVGSVVAGVLVQPIAYAFPRLGWPLAMAGAVVVVVVWRLTGALRRRTSAASLRRDLGATVFVQLYVTLLGSCAVVLTAQPGGQWWTLSFIVIVVATDLFAYISGLAFGRHPMAPRISPKKTWEGFAGSALAAVVAGLLVGPLMLGQPIWLGAVLGLVLAGTATLGDLTESLIKRDLGIKDISSWLPGHGGFLDRVDSILPSATAALLLYFSTHPALLP